MMPAKATRISSSGCQSNIEYLILNLHWITDAVVLEEDLAAGPFGSEDFDNLDSCLHIRVVLIGLAIVAERVLLEGDLLFFLGPATRRRTK